MRVPEPPSDVAVVFRSYPPPVRKKLLAVRRLIYSAAHGLRGVGGLTETLKWGQPAYLTKKKSGSTIRLGWQEKKPDDCALYFICTTTLVSDFRAMFDGALRFEGNRALLLSLNEPLPKEPLEVCIKAALTYHQNK